MNRDEAHLVYIIESASLIIEALKDSDRTTYDTDWIFKAAMLRTLQTLSESVTKLSDAVKHDLPTIPWEHIRSFRNALAHGYLGEISDDLVWQVMTHELQPLKETLQHYFEEHYGR
jgi:uncharacterized protein with HEPN domain